MRCTKPQGQSISANPESEQIGIGSVPRQLLHPSRVKNNDIYQLDQRNIFVIHLVKGLHQKPVVATFIEATDTSEKPPYNG